MGLHKFLILGTISLLLGCGKSPSADKPSIELQQLNGTEYIAVAGSNLASKGTSIEGTGKVVFRTPLVEPDNNYALTFQLGDEGKLCLVSQTDNTLGTGVRFCFLRNSDNSLKVELSAGSESYDLSEDFVGISAKEALSTSLDIHGHGHLIVWLKELELEYAFSTRLTGTLWGLELTNTTVTSAIQGPPKEAH